MRIGRATGGHALTSRAGRRRVLAGGRALTVGLGLLAAVGLSGCAGSGQPRAATAAEVGDHIITVDWLQDQVSVFEERFAGQAQTGADQADFQRSVLEQGILTQLYEEVAEREGLEVTDEVLGEAEAQVRDQLAGGPSVPEYIIEEQARLSALHSIVLEWLADGEPVSQENSQAIAERYQTELSAVAEDVGIEVNPRYGALRDQLDFLQNGGILDPAGGALVQIQPPETQVPGLPGTEQGPAAPDGGGEGR